VISRVCCALLLVLSVSAQSAKPWLYRVDQNVFRGKQPTRQEISELAAMGIKTVLDLRGGLGHKGWERKAVEAAGMRYVRIGLSGFLPPTETQMDRILAVLENPSLSPIFVHCRRGADRSGLVIACYRIAHDHWTNAQAMQEARAQGFSRLEVLMRRYVKHFTAVDPAVASR
jgi:tyrosine-protein phosphatase SIW14